MNYVIIILDCVLITGCVVSWLILRIFRRRFLPLWSSWWERTPFILFAFLAIWVVWDRAMPTTGTNVTPQVANEILTGFAVPVTATAVDYCHSRFRETRDEAHFTISEEDFLGWMKSKGWPIREFYTDEQGFHWAKPSEDEWRVDHVEITSITNAGEEPESIKIRNGYEFVWNLGDHMTVHSFMVNYDKNAHRAYVRRGIYTGRQ